MSRVKTSTLAAFRMPIVFKDLIDQAVEKEGSNFSEFMRDAARMKLEKMNIEVKK